MPLLPLWESAPDQGRSRKQAIVFGVCADPYPGEASRFLDCEDTVAQTYSRRPELADLLELKRGVAGIVTKKREVLVGKLSHGLRQVVITLPEIRGRAMLQRGRVLPAAISAFALAMNLSRRPALASASISVLSRNRSPPHGLFLSRISQT